MSHLSVRIGGITTHFSEEVLDSLPDTLRPNHIVTNPINPVACRSHWFGIPLLHLTRWGGWKDYVVLEPEFQGEWYVGWWTITSAGVSRIPLTGAVRMLCGPQPTVFFGLNREGVQIPIRKVGNGRIGDRGTYRSLPLL